MPVNKLRCWMDNVEPLLLGIDVGTSSVKAVLLDLGGNLCAVCQAEYPLLVRMVQKKRRQEAW